MDIIIVLLLLLTKNRNDPGTGMVMFFARFVRLGNLQMIPDNKVHGANMGPIWNRQDPGGPTLAPWTLLSGTSNWMSAASGSVLNRGYSLVQLIVVRFRILHG